MSQLELLSLLEAGAVEQAARAVGHPLPDLVARAASGDSDAVRAIAATPSLVAETLSSAAGPLLAAPLAQACSAVGRASLLPSATQRLVAAPLHPGPLLNRLLELAADDPVGVAVAATRLDELYRDLPAVQAMPEGLARALALPAAVGMCADVYVVASETGAVPLSSGPPLANILRVALDQADAVAVLDVLNGTVSPDRVTVPAEVLAASAFSAADLGAYATAARLAVLAVLVGDRGREPSEGVLRARRELERLMGLTTRGGRHRVLMGASYRDLVRALLL